MQLSLEHRQHLQIPSPPRPRARRRARFPLLTLPALLLLTIAAADAAPEPTPHPVVIESLDYRGWMNTFRLANGLVEIYATSEVGPRIVDFRIQGGDNVFYLRPGEVGGKKEREWMFRGGWRLWVAPEARETTYVPDNQPCTAEVRGAALQLTGSPQSTTGIQKIVEIQLIPDQPRARIVSRLRNIGSKPVTYAAWSLSVMRPGGRAFAPLDLGQPSAFADIRRLILWSYTEWDDPRYSFGDRLVQVDHSRVASAAGQSGRRDDESKIGVDSSQGWSAYLSEKVLYLKRFPHIRGASYPDGGSTIEVYSSAEFLELENLGPLVTIEPGDELVYPEEWSLFADAAAPGDEAGALARLEHYVGRTPAVEPMSPLP